MSSLHATFSGAGTGASTPSGLKTPTTPVGQSEMQGLLGVDVEQGAQEYGTRQARGPTTKPISRRTSTWAKVNYYVPSTAWIPRYSWSLLSGDVIAGLTVACMLIPQSVSYATSLARLNPITGLFSASVPGLVYALFGTSRQLNVSPEASISLLIGQAVDEFLHDSHFAKYGREKVGFAVSTVVMFQVGLISLLLGLLRLGFMDVVLSRALLRGFVSAMAIVIMIEQLIPMFGLTALRNQRQLHSTADKFFFIIDNVWAHGHPLTMLISFGALAVLLLIRSFKNLFRRYAIVYRLPEVLLVVICSTIVSDKLDWDESGVEILGSVPINTGSSLVQFPIGTMTLKFLRRTTSLSVLCVIVGFLDSIVAAKQNAGIYGYSISPNRELVALGAGNLAGSFVPGTLPAFGSITRSKINGEVGARTQMASLLCSAIILLAVFYLLPWLYYLPKAVLAAVICLVVFSLLAEIPHDLKFYWRLRSWVDLSLMALTFVLTIFWDLEIGIAVSLVISLLLVVHRSSKTRMTILGRIPGTDTWKPIDENPEAQEDASGVLIVRIRENLYFANTAQLKERLRRLELYGVSKHHPSDEPHREHASVLVFHLADVDSIDASAAQIFYELVETYQSRGVGLYITHLKKGPHITFERAGIVKLLGEDSFCKDVAAAMIRIEQSSRERHERY
ncbi:sulfate anion transporter [Laetiporus sulphureus 93-53]|uniref:Sulfate anion transporter n=1 Tax=Laetiporus sulphureus 93-53 TaxID=1314785 RepID=A0A165D146_9APHY|nr:sulfate anion transporter [Laetiporus sulphureus 93-53]KZT03929.1 sulfate anion transporter [Laetiporus sulphureus 93-53]